MNTIIIDDEQPAVKILRSFVQKVPFLSLRLATTNAFDGLEILNSETIDLLLLDINMPDITGIELLKSLEKKPYVIFTTAYEQYAVEGYELDVLDYLVKPIRFERFLKAVNKANYLYNLSGDKTKENSEDFLLIKENYKNVKIKYASIKYIEGLKDYVKIHTTDKMYMPRLNMKAIAAKLPEDKFIRVHRSYIVSLDQISSFQKGQVFIGAMAIPVGVSYQKELQQRLN